METRSTLGPLLSNAELEREAALARTLAERLLFDADLAEDAIQQTWLAVLEHPPRDPEHAGGWFTAIAKNCALKILRTRGRAARREHLAPATDSIEPSPLETLDHVDLVATLRDEVEKLAEPYRKTLKQRFYEGIPPRRIAEIEGLTVDAIRSRLQRGLAMLRDRLEARAGATGRRDLACGLFVLAKRPDAHAFAEALAMRARATVRAAWPRTIPPRFALLGAVVLSSVLSLQAISLLTHRGEDLLEEEGDHPSMQTARPAALERDGGVERHAVLDAASSTENTQACAASRALEIVVERERDGSPAAGIRVEAICFADPNPLLMPRPLITDASGRAVLLDAPEGPARIRLDRGGAVDVTIAASGVTAKRIELPLGVDVNGTVIDAFGRPVEGAAIWLSQDDAATRGSFVTTTDAAGRFTLGDISPGRSIAAFQREGSPSPSVVVAGIRGSDRTIELRLGSRPASITGTLLDANGHPVVGRVRIESLASERSLRAPPPLEVDCGADGRFLASGLRSGRTRITARSPVHPSVSVDVELTADVTLDRVIELHESTLVRGSVRDRDGTAIPLAFVRVGEGSGFDDCLVRADHDGNYSLFGVAVGARSILADSEHGSAAESIVVHARTANYADLVIESGAPCEGRLQALDGDSTTDLSTFTIRLERLDQNSWVGARTVDALRSGRFAFSSVAAGKYRLTVEMRGMGSDSSALVTGRIVTLPQPEPLVLEVPPPQTPSVLAGSIRGRSARSAFVEVVDAQGVLPTRTLACDTGGRFRCESMRPGDYYLRGHDADGRRGRFVPLTLEPGATKDIEIELPRLAVLELTCSTAASAEQTSLRVLDDTGTCVVDRNALEPLTRIELPPGEYQIRATTRLQEAALVRSSLADASGRAPKMEEVRTLETRLELRAGDTSFLRIEPRTNSR